MKNAFTLYFLIVCLSVLGSCGGKDVSTRGDAVVVPTSPKSQKPVCKECDLGSLPNSPREGGLNTANIKFRIFCDGSWDAIFDSASLFSKNPGRRHLITTRLLNQDGAEISKIHDGFTYTCKWKEKSVWEKPRGSVDQKAVGKCEIIRHDDTAKWELGC